MTVQIWVPTTYIVDTTSASAQGPAPCPALASIELHDHRVFVTDVAVPSFLFGVTLVAGLGLSVVHPETGMVADLLACCTELLAAKHVEYVRPASTISLAPCLL